MSKRPAAVMLNTNWQSDGSSTDGTDKPCTCALCQKRGRLSKETLEAKIADGKGSHYCAIRCGGTRVAGMGDFTHCKKRALPFTLCHGCVKVIEPVWHMEKAERERILALGKPFEELVEINATIIWYKETGGAGGV